ncbi:S-adenosyl-L-methionine-dependent methyltransferase [Thermoascus aurantiacus ATCC 26904]
MASPDSSRISAYTPTARERVAAMLEPAVLLSKAMYHYVVVCLEAVFKRGEVLAPVLSAKRKRLRDEAFGRFWLEFSAQPQRQPQQENDNGSDKTESPSPPVGSAALIPPLLATASGVVLDIGPGSGTQMPLLRSPAIRAIYGAEPCVDLHDELRARAAAAGLQDKYHVLPCSVEKKALVPELEKHGIAVPEPGSGEEGVFDTIICVRVLCSVPDPDRTIADLYDLLRPGGRMLVTEHVVNPWRTRKGSFVARAVQAVYEMLGWSFFVGDCHMDRDTAASLRRAADKDGGWESVELESSFGWSPMPYISGTLVKKGRK